MQKNKQFLTLYKLFLAAGLPGYILFSINILKILTFRQRSLDDYNTVDNSAFVQIIYIAGIFIVSCYILYKEPQKRKFLFSKPQVFLLLYIVICFLSMIWTPNIFVTGYRAFESLTYLLLISLVAYNLITSIGHDDIIDWVILWMIWDFFWSITLLFKLGNTSFFIFLNASRLSLPLTFFFALLLTKRIYFKYLILLVSIFMASNKVYFGIVFGLVGFLFGDFKYKKWLIFFFLSILIALIFVDSNTLLLETLFHGRQEANLANTSGRDVIWGIAWEAFLNKPVLGYGFVAGENMALYSKFQSAISTHSFFFSGLLGTGIVGVLFLLLYFLSAFRASNSIYFPSSKWRPAMVSTFIMCLIVSLTAPGIGGRVYGSWIPIVMIYSIINALQFKFKVSGYIRKYNKIKIYENNLGHKKLFRLPDSGIQSAVGNTRS